MSKNRIHSVLTALPPLMLIIGLYVYYRAEQKQLAGPPILEESVSYAGQYKGTSAVKSFGEEQLFFWVDTEERARGARMTGRQKFDFENLQAPLVIGEPLEVDVAPRVAGSTTYWLVEIRRSGQ